MVFLLCVNVFTTVQNNRWFDMAKRRIRDEFGEAYKPSDRLKKKRGKQVEDGEMGVVQGDGEGIQLELSLELINRPLSRY